MSTPVSQSPKAKSPIQVLRERRGGVPKHLVERNREQDAVRRKLVEGLRSGPKTVPELAGATGVPRHEVLWHVMAMRKYGKVAETQERDAYFLYALIEGKQTTESSS